MIIKINKFLWMITFNNTDENKQTITYKDAYKLVSKILNKACKKTTLRDIHKDLKNKNIVISYNLLSQIKNRRLPHEYPGVVEKLFIYFGITDFEVDRETLFTFKKDDLEGLKKP